MASFLKTLRNDRRGNVLAIAAAALPLVIGSAGLATDTVQWTTWNRQLQRAADSAAFAGVYAKAQSKDAGTAVSTDLTKNNYTPPALLSTYPKVAFPAGTTAYSNAVRVTLAVQQKLPFSSLFLSAAPIIEVSATAAMVDTGEYCVVALEPSTDPGITIQGSSSADLGCGAISNSMSGTKSVDDNGSAYSFKATVVAGAGGLPSAITGTPKLLPYQMPLPDPFKDLYPTDIPSSELPCKKATGFTLDPGCFTDFKFSGSKTYTLNPGVYYLNNADFDVSGSVTITGTGVTIILTGSSPGTMKTNGTSTIQLTAPTSGTYEKMLLIQSANATADNKNTINGNNTSKYDGAFYFPKGEVEFTGSSGAVTKCVMLVSKKSKFSGNANLQNDVTGCVANKTVKGKMIKLVA